MNLGRRAVKEKGEKKIGPSVPYTYKFSIKITAHVDKCTVKYMNFTANIEKLGKAQYKIASIIRLLIFK